MRVEGLGFSPSKSVFGKWVFGRAPLNGQDRVEGSGVEDGSRV